MLHLFVKAKVRKTSEPSSVFVSIIPNKSNYVMHSVSMIDMIQCQAYVKPGLRSSRSDISLPRFDIPPRINTH